MMKLTRTVSLTLLLLGFSSNFGQASAKGDFDWNSIAKGTVTSGCSVGLRRLIDGIGDNTGQPLTLDYNDTNIAVSPTSKTQTDWRTWNDAVVLKIKQNLEHNSERVAADDKLVVARVRFEIRNGKTLRILSIENPSGFKGFEQIIKNSLTALNGDPVLKLPPTVKSRTFVLKTGRFSQNYGPRFIKHHDEEARSGQQSASRPILKEHAT